MGLIFDMQVTRPDFAANLSFYRKATPDRFTALAAGNPYSMYGFQGDEATLVGSYNEGTSGVLGNMAWTNIGLRTGDGWYSSAGMMLQAGMRGFGMTNNGGGSGFVGSVVSHSGNSVAGSEYMTIHVVFRATTAGEGGAGVLFSKENAYRLRFSAANTLIFEVWDGAAWRGSDTGANVVYGYWHHLTIVFDGSLAAVNRIKMHLNGRDATVAGANIPAALVDDLGAVLYILDNAGNTAAWNGQLGLLMIQPDVPYTLAQAQSLIELKGLFQATAANQPTIKIPEGYDFDGAADPNSDHLRTYQVQPLKTTQGSVLIWFIPDDFVNLNVALSLTTPIAIGAGYESQQLAFRGDLAGDPFNIFSQVNDTGIFDSLTFAQSLIIPSSLNFICCASNGITSYGYLNGNNMVVTAAGGANSGRWFAAMQNASVFSNGLVQRNTTVYPLNGKQSKLLIYDRPLSQLELQKIQYNGFGSSGPRFYPRS